MLKILDMKALGVHIWISHYWKKNPNNTKRSILVLLSPIQIVQIQFWQGDKAIKGVKFLW